MGFQSTVSLQQGFSIAGKQCSDGPWRAQTYTINSSDATTNIIGASMCSIISEGVCATGNTGGTAVFAGLLVDPKDVALFGASGIPLNPTLTVPNYTVVECATIG